MISTPKFWYKNDIKSRIIRIFLSPISLIYKLCFFIDSVINRPHEIKGIKTICIGGIITGGSGKTPITCEIAKIISERTKKKFCIISKGYGIKIKKPLFIKKGCINKYDYKKFSNKYGDESIILSNFSDVIICNTKLSALEEAKKLGYEIAIIDDSLQTHNIKKDLTIIVINAKQKFGNEYVLPAGPLRQPVKSGLKKADAIIIVNDINKNFESEYSKFLLNKKILKCSFNINITGKKLFAFCGIGYPEKFFQALKNNNNTLIRTKSFPDHHKYTNYEIENIIKFSLKKGLDIATTEKDIVKINERYYNAITVARLQVLWESFDESIFKEIC